MRSVVLTARRRRRPSSSRRLLARSGCAGRWTVLAVAALAGATGAVAPTYARAASVADPPDVRVSIALAVGVVVVLASAITFHICRLRSAPRPVARAMLAACGAFVGGILGLTVTLIRGPASMGAIRFAAVAAITAGIACAAAAYAGNRGTGRWLAGTTRRRTWPVSISLCIGFAALAITARHADGVAAVAVPGAVALVIAFGLSAAVGPVARWFGRQLVREAEMPRDGVADPSSRRDVVVIGTEYASKEDRASDDRRRRGRDAIAVAAYLGRRPGVGHAAALVAVAVALAGAASFSWVSGYQMRQDRAAMELGAARVLTVTSVPASQLLSAVRSADPSGRYAMAAVDISSTPFAPAVLAVDSARLAHIQPSGVRGGPDGAALASLIRPKRLVPTTVTGTALQLNLAAAGDLGSPVRVVAVLDTPDGVTRGAAFGPVRTGEHVYTSEAPCAAGCTLRGFAVTADAHENGLPVAVSASLVLRELRQNSPDLTVLATNSFGDGSRWRLESGATPVHAAIAGSEVGLAVTVDIPAGRSGGATISLDDGISVPAVAGPLGARGGLIGGAVPVRVIQSTSPVPGVPAGGLLVDLDALLRDGGESATVGANQVRLAADAPPGVLTALEHQGVVSVHSVTLAERTDADVNQPAVVVARFQLVASIIALCCAMLLVGAVTRAHRGARGPARGIGLAGVGWLTGLVGAVIARHAAPDATTTFADGWHLLGPPAQVSAGAFVAFAIVSAALFGIAVALGAFGSRGPARVVRPPDTTRTRPAVDPCGDQPAAGPWTVSRGR